MKNKKTDSFYSLFYKNGNNGAGLLDFLMIDSPDEIFYVDVENDTYHLLYHVDGKYSVPQINGIKYSELYEFVTNYIVHPDDVKFHKRLLNPKGMVERLKNNPTTPGFDYEQYRYRLRDGSYRWVEECIITGEELGVEKGRIYFFVFDVQNNKVFETGVDTVKGMNLVLDIDEVTNLLTKKPFLAKAQELIDKKKDITWCVASIDIDHFKLFDEWYGREAGDMLLAKIGAILKEDEKEFGGVAGYFGQDDFSILIPYERQNIELLFEDIKSVITDSGYSVGFLPAIGVSVIEEGLSLLDAFDKASIATSEAKSDIRKRIYFYDIKMHKAVDKENKILSDFMIALKNDELEFYLQPQCRLSTGKIVGAESLARWIKKDGTVVYPNDFVPILEKYGFITELDSILWEKVCVWLRKWIDAGHKPVPISLNVSRADIFTIDVFKFFTDLVNKYKLDPKLLKLEITESAYAENSEVIGELVSNLRESGFAVLMDDFGSGYSSLNMLSNLKVDAIKLDALFLDIKMNELSKGVHILESVINMAKVINIPIIVEGVEVKGQRDFLEELGCRYVQGYYYYKPMPVADFEKIIKYENNVDERGFVAKLNEQFRIREFLDKNIYSDTMLNNILGPVAIYSWDGKDKVDIVRFNQQFYETVDVPDFKEKLENVQMVVPEADKEKFYGMFSYAKDHRLLGCKDTIRFYKFDGTLTAFDMHIYYIGVNEGTDRFYGSTHNITELEDVRQAISLISQYSDDSFAFLKKVNDKWVYKLVAYGLYSKIGLTKDSLEEELNSGAFYKRFKGNQYQKIHKIANNYNFKDPFTYEASIKKNDGEYIDVEMTFIPTNDVANNIKYMILLKQK